MFSSENVAFLRYSFGQSGCIRVLNSHALISAFSKNYKLIVLLNAGN